MPIPGLDPDRCQKRSRLAARKGLNSAPVALSTRPPGPIDTADPATSGTLRVITAKGKLPRTIDDAVERINEVRGADAEPLTADQVHVVYLEAGNSNFISKYAMHLGATTLRNIAVRASKSIAFMNSHRTGGMSTDAELPYGRTFAGRFEQALAPDGRTFSRTLLGVYMVRGQRPNGANGPSTDDLYQGIKAGTIFDVSLGILGGDEICDVCGNDLRLYDLESGEPVCPHIPGTHHKMDDDEIAAAAARGVPEGVASFTLENATAPEVSPVFDGAVPGAGFRKALSAARSRQLSAASLDEARHAFAPLVGRGDFDSRRRRDRPSPQPQGEPMPPQSKPTTVNLADAFRFWKAAGEPDTIDIAAFQAQLGGDPPKPAPSPSAAPKPDPAQPVVATAALSGQETPDDPRFAAMQDQVAALNRQLAEERATRLQNEEAGRRATYKAQGEAWAQQQVRLGVAIPAEADELAALHAQAAYDDHASPAPVAYRDPDNTPKLGSRVDALSALMRKRAPHGHAREFVATATPGSAAASPGNPNPAPDGPRPLVDLGSGVAPQSRDPIGDAMEASALKFAAARNGKARPRG